VILPAVSLAGDPANRTATLDSISLPEHAADKPLQPRAVGTVASHTLPHTPHSSAISRRDLPSLFRFPFETPTHTRGGRYGLEQQAPHTAMLYLGSYSYRGGEEGSAGWGTAIPRCQQLCCPPARPVCFCLSVSLSRVGGGGLWSMSVAEGNPRRGVNPMRAPGESHLDRNPYFQGAIRGRVDREMR